MNSSNGTPAMNQMIFEMGFSVETISVYLLCCSLADSGSAISTKNLLGIWNSNGVALREGLKILEQHKILTRIISDREDANIYRLTAVDQWEKE